MPCYGVGRIGWSPRARGKGRWQVNLEVHIAAGWLLGNLWPGAGRRERLLALAAASLSDLDGLSYLAGRFAYVNWHHTIGHGVLTMAPLVLLASLVARKGRMLSTALLIELAFLTHLLGDYFFSGWGLQLLWPISHHEVMFRPRIGLDHPVNIALSYLSFLLMAGSLWIWGRSPLEFIRPGADSLLARAVRPRRLRCDECGQKLLLSRAVLAGGYRIICRTCCGNAQRRRLIIGK